MFLSIENSSTSNIEDIGHSDERRNVPIVKEIIKCNVSLPFFRKSNLDENMSASSSVQGIADTGPSMDCPACKAGHFATVHKCVFCSKFVHLFESCSVPVPGSEEGYGQQVMCLKCCSPSIDDIPVPVSHNENRSANTSIKTVDSFKKSVPNQHPKNGLTNVGNACYLNSVIQCLNSTEELANYLLSQEFDPNGEGPFVFEEAVLLIKKLRLGRKELQPKS